MDSIHLHGAEDVRSAGHTINGAAETIKQAASSLDWTFTMFSRKLDDTIIELRDLLNSDNTKLIEMLKRSKEALFVFRSGFPPEGQTIQQFASDALEDIKKIKER